LTALDKNLVIKDYNAEANLQQANLIAEQIAHDNNIIGIFAIGTLASQAVAKAEKSRPIVIAAVSDPLAIANPLPKNVCGFSDALDANYQIATIQKLLPKIKSISLLYSPSEANSAFMVKNLKQAAELAHISAHLVGTHDTQSIMSASLEACIKADAVLIPL